MRARTFLAAVLLGVGCQRGYWWANATDVPGTTTVHAGNTAVITLHVAVEADEGIFRWRVFLKPTALVLSPADAGGSEAVIKIEVIAPVPGPDDDGPVWFSGHADDTGVDTAGPVDTGVDVQTSGWDSAMASLGCPGSQPSCAVDVQFAVSVVGGKSDVELSWVASADITGDAGSCDPYPKGTVTLSRSSELARHGAK